MTEGVKKATRRGVLLAGAVFVAGLGGASGAVADAGLVDLKVVDRETGRELPVWRHGGRLFVAGEPGARYGLRLRNRTDGRVLLVLSVDGVNVLTGETAQYGQRGYVLDPYDAYDVNGWRKSQAEVAAFTFAPLPRSYAARTGRPGDVGVIGMAVFEERAPPSVAYTSPPTVQWDRRESGRASADAVPPPPPLPLPPVRAPMAAAPSMSSALGRSAEASLAQPRDEKLGTAHGAREWLAATVTTFVRATSYPQSVRQIEYDTRSNLVARGVIPAYPYVGHRPRPFPMEPGSDGFVPDPPPYDR